MKRFLFAIFALAIGLYCVSSPAQWNGCQAGFCNQAKTVATYQGPGDVFSTSVYAWYSCARGYNAAYAAPGTNPACDVVDSATGLVTCTYHVGTNGFVNPSECTGVGQACATACKVTKAYDESGNGRDAIQATLASMPVLTFSSTPRGTLPSITCSGTVLLATASTFTIPAPITLSTVYIRTSGTTEGGAIGTASRVTLGAASGANLAEVRVAGFGSTLTASASDAAWHSLQGLIASTGAINVDGTDTTGAVTSSGSSAEALRLCRPAALELIGNIAEAGIWAATSTSTDRGNLSTNQHGANGYNF